MALQRMDNAVKQNFAVAATNCDGAFNDGEHNNIDDGDVGDGDGELEGTHFEFTLERRASDLSAGAPRRYAGTGTASCATVTNPLAAWSMTQG